MEFRHCRWSKIVSIDFKEPLDCILAHGSLFTFHGLSYAWRLGGVWDAHYRPELHVWYHNYRDIILTYSRYLTVVDLHRLVNGVSIFQSWQWASIRSLAKNVPAWYENYSIRKRTLESKISIDRISVLLCLCRISQLVRTHHLPRSPANKLGL